MESGKVLPFLCLILVCVLHLSSGQCPRNEELVDCRNDCNTCELKGFCYDCSSVACDCIWGYARNSEGVCIPTSRCSGTDGDGGDVQVASSGGCPNQKKCQSSCKNGGKKGGKCGGKGSKNCICF